MGCIWNDFNDKNFDILVSRTKNRLIASGKDFLKEIIIYSFIKLTFNIFLYFSLESFLYFCVLWFAFNYYYPFMKRITWWPQLWLGLNFNWGILVGYYSVSDIAFKLMLFFFLYRKHIFLL